MSALGRSIHVRGKGCAHDHDRFAHRDPSIAATGSRARRTRWPLRERSDQLRKPRFEVVKRPMLGNTSGMSAALTPYQEARVAAYCSTEAVGIQRPRLSVSLGPPS